MEDSPFGAFLPPVSDEPHHPLFFSDFLSLPSGMIQPQLFCKASSWFQNPVSFFMKWPNLHALA